MRPEVPPAQAGGMRTVVLASFIGALMEWYDFYIFATASAIVFGRIFFPGDNPVAGTMAAFGAFAAGFVARPLGGLLFGHIGDRLGRKAGLIGTVSIIGIGTVLMGVLPSWRQAGMLSPALLVALRVLQGIGLGGEYGGAALMTIEHAPADRRGFWGSLPQAASPAGLLLATGVFSLAATLPQQEFLRWGWRVPFLLSVVLLAVGLFVRLRVAETPEFLKTRGTAGAPPALELMRHHKRIAGLAMGARLAETVSGNMVKSFALSYATLELHFTAKTALNALVGTAVVAFAATPLFGWISDRVGRRTLYLAGTAAAAALAFPFFWLLAQRGAAALWIAFILLYTLGPTLMLSVQATFFAELFGTRIRYTALSMAYQISAILGGFVPLIAFSLLHAAGGAPWLVATFLCLVSLLSLGCVIAARPG